MKSHNSIYDELLSEFYKQDRSNGVLYFDSPKLRYLSIEQAEKWIDIGKSANTHTKNNETELVVRCLTKTSFSISNNINIIDWGCGDGAKASHIIDSFIVNGHTIRRYTALDINPRLIEESLQRISSSCLDKSIELEGINIDFEEFPAIAENIYNSYAKDEYVIHLLLGNTFNNFESKYLIDILASSVNHHNHFLLVGAKCRSSSSKLEIQKFIDEYQSYGSDFTFSFGHLLGLQNEKMKRVVKYNTNKKRIEVWIIVKQASDLMKQMKLGNIRKFRVLNSYKPTIHELKSIFYPFYNNVEVYINEGNTEAVFCCSKKSD